MAWTIKVDKVFAPFSTLFLLEQGDQSTQGGFAGDPKSGASQESHKTCLAPNQEIQDPTHPMS